MESKSNIKAKASFYHNNKLKCHIKIKPIGFVNGIIHSELIEGMFYWFEDLRKPGQKERLFLVDIFDIKDYEEIVE